MSSRKLESPPIITNNRGLLLQSDKDFALTFDQDVSKSCSLTWRGDFYIFGGDRQSKSERQILKLIDCIIFPLGSLSFEHYYGGCGTSDDELIYLCFTEKDGNHKKCRSATSPQGSYSELPVTNYIHRRTRIGVNPGKLI